MSNVAALIESQRTQIQRALPRHMSADKMARVALTEIRKNPELGMCDPISFLGAIVQCAHMGLEPSSVFGHVYLIPFNNRKAGRKEVQIITGYRGFLELANRSDDVGAVVVQPVYENEDFSFIRYANEDKIEHHTNPFGDRGELVGVYAICRLINGHSIVRTISKADVDKVARDNDIWRKYYEEMAMKTAIRRLSKHIPQSPELAKFSELTDREDIQEGQDLEQILLDAGVKPAEPDSSANVKRILAEDKSPEVRERVRVSALDRLQGRIEELCNAGSTIEAVSAYLKTDDLVNAESWEIAKLNRAYEALLGFKG